MFGKKFKNLDGHFQTPLMAFKWLFSRKPTPWPKNVLRKEFPKPPPFYDQKEEVLVTFVGHSTVLLQVNGLNILTDPVLSTSIGLNKYIGVKRSKEVGVDFKDLPKIDLILLTHDHYDHMDLATLKKIENRDHPFIITSLGNLKKIKKIGFKDAVELDWWQSFNFGSLLNITYVPSQHFSGRSLMGANKTLWGGFVIELGSSSIYFAGDTGYGQHFELIKERFPKIELSFLPIGVYEPRWFLQYIHMGPDEAVKAHQILESKQSIGIHFGTFRLSDEGIDEPLKKLEQALIDTDLDRSKFITLSEGESRVFKLK
jgi:L-ascorbate metabolism protein UlaG (beta-lactamase superfamily)